MKKIISLVLALTLCIALAVIPAFAAGISGDEYAGEAKFNAEQTHPLAAAALFELAAQAYEEAGDEDSALKAHVSAGEAYEAAGKTTQALKAYLAAKDFDKATELLLSRDTEELSGDDYLSVAAELAKLGAPESKLTELYENALAAYMNGALSGYELAAAANKLATVGVAAEKLTGIYEKAARTLLNEAKAEENGFKALTYLLKANDLTDKHGNAELAAEISAALETAQKEVEEYAAAYAVFEIAQKNSDNFDQFISEFFPCFNEYFPGYMRANQSQEEVMRLCSTLSLAGDLCVNKGLYLHAFQLYQTALTLSVTYMDDGSVESLDSNEVFQTMLDKISYNIKNIIRQASSMGGFVSAENIASMMLTIFTSVLNDYDLALEWAAKFDEMHVPCPYGTWVSAISLAKAAVEAGVQQTGSTLSEGSLTIVVGVAAAVVFGLGGFLIGKKKKPAVLGGIENTDEE